MRGHKFCTTLGVSGDVPEWRRHLQPCEYIKPNSVYPYIDSGYVANNNTVIYCKTRKCVSGDYMIFGSGVAYKNKQFAFQCRTKQYGYEINNTSFIATGIYAIENENFDEIFFGKNIVKVNDIIITNSLTYTNQNDYGLYIFNTIRGGTNANIGYQGEMQIFKIIENNEIIKNLLSCYVIDEYTDNKGNFCSADVPGMVDVLSGAFYTNDGSGQFSHGADINL